MVVRLRERGAGTSSKVRPYAKGRDIRNEYDPLLCSAIAHAAPSSTVEPASQLLLAVSLTFAPEWHALLPAAVERLGDELRERGRALPPRAAQLLLRAALRPSPLSAFDFVALWNDLAQVTRMGVSERALERYQPR